MNDHAVLPDQARPPAAKTDFHFLAYPDNILVWMSNPAGECNFVSPSWSTFTGRDKAEELGSGWQDHVHPDDRAPLVHALDEARRNQQPFRQLFRYLREDGAFRWLMGLGIPHITPADEFIGHLCQCFDVTPCHEGEAQMEDSIQNVFPLLKKTRLIAVILDRKGQVQFSNGGLCRLLKHSQTELVGSQLFERHLSANNRELLETLYPDGKQNAHFPTEFESELVTSKNEYCRISWHAVVWREFSGRVKGAVLIGDDVTKLRCEEEQTSLYMKAFEATDHAIVVTDSTNSIISANRAFTEITGYSRDDVLGQNPRILQSGRHDQSFYAQLWATLLNTGHWHGDLWDRRKDGTVYPKYLSISAVKNPAGELTNYVGIFYDDSERKTIEERLDHLAHYDTLTGLPNRCLLLDRLEQAVERAIRLGTKVALLYLDLDHFKLINDAHGHSAGDELLKAAAHRMKTCVRGVDTVARLGGDEFVVLLPDCNDAFDIRTIARKLLETLTPAYEIEGRAAVSTPSIGISIYPDNGSTAEALVKNADIAMYQAKQSGRGTFRFFSDTAHLSKRTD